MFVFVCLKAHQQLRSRDISATIIGGGRSRLPLRAILQATTGTRVEPPAYRNAAG